MTSPAAQNRIPQRIIRALCIAAWRTCTVVGNVSGTRYSARRDAAISKTHQAARATGTKATSAAQKGGGGDRRQSRAIQVTSPTRAPPKTMTTTSVSLQQHR